MNPNDMEGPEAENPIDTQAQKAFLRALAWYRMPFGKYRDQYLLDLPLPYLVWFQRKGFPEGRLGMYMEAMLEIKDNGLEGLLYQIRKEFPEDAA